MMIDQYVLFECVVSLVALAYLYSRCYIILRRDGFRADIRRVRDDLFDYMWKNGHDYSIQAYRDTRQTLNGLLRVSNLLSAPFFLVTLLHVRKHGLGARKSPNTEHVQDPALRQAIEEAMNKPVLRLLKFVFLEGLTGLLVKAILLLICSVHVASRL